MTFIRSKLFPAMLAMHRQQRHHAEINGFLGPRAEILQLAECRIGDGIVDNQ
jgi:hypothetical protein